MKRFVFREAKLLSLRKQQVTIAELSVSAAKQQETDASRAVEAELNAVRALTEQILSGGANNVTYISHSAMGLRHRLEESRVRLAKAKENLSAAMTTLVRTNVAAESLAELETVRRREYAKYCGKQDQMQIDFLSSHKWMTKERDPDD